MQYPDQDQILLEQLFILIRSQIASSYLSYSSNVCSRNTVEYAGGEATDMLADSLSVEAAGTDEAAIDFS